MSILDMFLMVASTIIILLVAFKESPITAQKRIEVNNTLSDEAFDDWLDALDAAIIAGLTQQHYDCVDKLHDDWASVVSTSRTSLKNHSKE